MVADDAVSHALVSQLQDKIRTDEDDIRNCEQIIRCLKLTTLQNGNKRNDPQTDEVLTDDRRTQLYDVWTVKARTMLGLPDPPTPTPPPAAG